MADKAILEGSNWLTDDIVNAAQTMLADQFSIMTGFQNTNAGMTTAFAIEPDEFIQILHDGGGHWVMISTIGAKHPEVQMYDGLYCSLSSALKPKLPKRRKFLFISWTSKCRQVVTTVEYLQLHLPQL